MPSDLLPVPHFQQSREVACLQACARMVLAYLGQSLSADRLTRLLQAYTFGTPAGNIRRLSKLGYVVAYGQTTIARLRDYLAAGIPCIAFLLTGDLPYWDTNIAHAVVVVGIVENTIYVNDPEFAKAPQAIPLDHFVLAWSEFDYRYAVLTK